MRYALCINNGFVIDPQTKTARTMHIGVQDGRIAVVSDTPLDADEIIDAGGRVVCPGFIDVHGHVDGITTYTDHRRCAKLSLMQGVTTMVSGNCGASVLDVTVFFEEMEKGYVFHHAELIGGSTLRRMVGATNRYVPATKMQIEHMCCIARHAMCQGAAGISFGVGYTPGTCMEEMLALARVAKEFDRVVAIDTRMEDEYDISSLVESIELSRRTGARVLISHLVYQYGENLMEDALRLLDEARAQSVDVWADSGLYVDWATGIGSECFRESYIYANPHILNNRLLLVATGEYTGERLDEELYREMRTMHPNETVICKTSAEASIPLAFTRDYVMPSSDTAPYNPGEGHPQVAGSFAAFFRRVREEGMMGLEDAVRAATLLPAEVMRFPTKGRLVPGADADIVVFDPDVIFDNAAYVDAGEPDVPPEGIDWVIVNGKVAVKGKEVLDENCGGALRLYRACKDCRYSCEK